MPEAQTPSLASAIRFSISGIIESVHAFLAWNLAAVVAVAVILLLLPASDLAVLLVPLLAPVLCGLIRLAAASQRGDHVSLQTALPGIRHRTWTKVGLAALQCVVLLLATLNLVLAPAIGGLVGALSAVTSVYLGAAILAYALVGWTLICDPRRQAEPVRILARVALVVLLRRPLQILFLLLVSALGTIIVYNLVVLGLFLPSMVFLLIAGYVVPAADEIASHTVPRPEV